jgi:hypothetical protein
MINQQTRLSTEWGELKTLRVSNGALNGEKLPSRIKIFSWGANDTTKGIFNVGQKTLDCLAANQRSRGFERVALDYNHCSIEGSSEHTELLKVGRPPMIFGYGRPNVVSRDGMYLEDIQWTPLGGESARLFEDLSPAIQEADGEVIFVHSVALTPNGSAHGLTFFSAVTGKPPLKGLARMVAATERENAARGRPGLTLLAGSGSGSQVSTAPGRNATPQGTQAPEAMNPEAIATAVYSQMADDLVGDAARNKIRRMVRRAVNDAWLKQQRAKPGPPSPADCQKFEDDVERGTEAAVRAYARLKLGNPAGLQEDIAAALAKRP